MTKLYISLAMSIADEFVLPGAGGQEKPSYRMLSALLFVNFYVGCWSIR
jgi:hypothetical protein